MKVGIQLFSIKEHLAKDALGTMREVAKIGYKYIEPFANPKDGDEKTYGLGMTYDETKAFFDETGIKAVGAHYYPLGAPDFAGMCEYYAKLGVKQIGSGGAHFPGGREDVLRKCELMTKDAEIAKQFGLKYYYHNHYREYQPFEGEMVIDTIFKNTPKDLVFYQIDTFWAARGGVDPVEEIKKWQDQNRLIPLMHQKDFSKTARVPLNIWDYTRQDYPISTDFDQTTRLLELYAEVGTGILPIQDYIDAGNAAGIEYTLLEQDKTQIGEIESIKVSMEAFKKFKGIEWD